MISNLRGYFDGDGSLTFSPGTCRFSLNPIKINYYPLLDWSSQSKIAATQIKQMLINLGFSPFILQHIEKKGGKMRYVVRIGGRRDYEKFVHIINTNNPAHLTRILICEIFGYCPSKTTLQQRIEILSGAKSPDELYEIKPIKIRPMIMNKNEEKVLEVLSQKPTYCAKIMRETGMKCISSVLNRLEKFSQIKCLGLKKEGYLKRFYGITDIGRKRLNRIPKLRKRLKNQFHLNIQMEYQNLKTEFLE